MKTIVDRPSLSPLTVDQFSSSGKLFVAGDVYLTTGLRPIKIGEEITVEGANTPAPLDSLRYVISAKACNDEFTAMSLLNRWQGCSAPEGVGRYFQGVDCKDYANLIHELSMTKEECDEMMDQLVTNPDPVLPEWKNGDTCYHPNFQRPMLYVGFSSYYNSKGWCVVEYINGDQCDLLAVEIDDLTRSPNKAQRIEALVTEFKPEQLAEMVYRLEQSNEHK